MGDVTRLLQAASGGEAGASDALIAAVYAELRLVAAQKLARERNNATLQPTALVHEAYLRLLGGDDGQSLAFENRAHFFGAAAEAMRRILVERARRRARLRHGGAHQFEELDPDAIAELPADLDLLALDEALARFEREDPSKAALVKLRYFAGLTLVEAADVLGISRATADRRWSFARAWLYREVTKGDPQAGDATTETEP
ncbi:MAG: ECF-type sigma factor [Planctomycetota bacterium]